MLDESVSAAGDQHSERDRRAQWRASEYSGRQLCQAWIQSSAYTGDERPGTLLAVESGSWPIHLLQERA